MKFFLVLFLFSIFFVFSPSSGETGRGKPSGKTTKQREDTVKVLNSKAVTKINKRQARRMVPIRQYKKKGILGEKDNGLLAIRNTDDLSRKEKLKLKKLVNSENKDRNKLYKIISKANQHSEKQEALLRLNMFRAHLDVDPRGTYYFEKKQWYKK